MTALLSILERFVVIDNIVVHPEELRNGSTPVLIEEIRYDSIVVCTKNLEMTTMLSILKRFNMTDKNVVHTEELNNDNTAVHTEKVQHNRQHCCPY